MPIAPAFFTSRTSGVRRVGLADDVGATAAHLAVGAREAVAVEVPRGHDLVVLVDEDDHLGAVVGSYGLRLRRTIYGASPSNTLRAKGDVDCRGVYWRLMLGALMRKELLCLR